MNFSHDEYDPYIHRMLEVGDVDEEGRVFMGYQTERIEALEKLQDIAHESFGVHIAAEAKDRSLLEGEIRELVIVITVKGESGKQLRMFTCTGKGGLRALEPRRVEILPPWEFSLAKYATSLHTAAAREYVRRKLKKFQKAVA